MRGTRRSWIALAAVNALIAAWLIVLVLPQASGETTYRIRVGRFLTEPPGAESRRFFPGEIRVHRGDLLRFLSRGYVSVALLPEGQQPGSWVRANWKGVGGAWSPFVRDRDEASGHLKMNPRVALPSQPTCGGPFGDPCEFDGSGPAVDGVLSSGLPLASAVDFTVLITARAKATLWAINLMDPKMRMKVVVVPPARQASSQRAIDLEAERLVAQDQETASALHERYVDLRRSVVRDGRATWQAWAGIDTPTVSLPLMYPRTLVLQQGDVVRWRFDRLRHVAHTVTFPATRAARIGAQPVSPVCDPGVRGDHEAEVAGPPFCDDPRDLELDVASRVPDPAGNGVFLGADDLESSGVRGGGVATSRSSYLLRFPGASPAAGYAYRCVLHPSMLGRVVVRGP